MCNTEEEYSFLAQTKHFTEVVRNYEGYGRITNKGDKKNIIPKKHFIILNPGVLYMKLP